MFSLGIDLGSTTIKYVLLDENGDVVGKDYLRHQSAVGATLIRGLKELLPAFDGRPLRVAMTGSGALSLAGRLGLPFIQEVVADSVFLQREAVPIDAAVELGGEDAKLLYLTGGVELRMNEACAGGTGAFLDQMASLLDVSVAQLDAMAQEATVSHPIASRCGVFAKTDVVSLLNAGIPKCEIARSIFDAVAEQTVAGLSCGRALRGRIAFLGGPLAFLPQLRAAFERKLSRPGNTFADIADGQYAVAWGAALQIRAESQSAWPHVVWQSLSGLITAISNLPAQKEVDTLAPLFATPAEYAAFHTRHAAEKAARGDLASAQGDLFLGVDLGSTTVKGVLTDSQGRILWSWYESNEGSPLVKLYAQIKKLLTLIPAGAKIRSACTTGYGAELAKAALGAPFAEVETLAHQRAAVAFDPQASYVIDIGGQDMKCLAVRQGLIASVKLNEACSSGCGSFLQTYAAQLNLTLPEFVAAAENAKNPCDLGTRCTVFMNSRVRQAQRDGAQLGDIAAGLCRSIVRNALYKVLRIHDPSELGSHVVVQGGTFLNDAVLRAFEQQIGRNVIRPDIAGLMGAFGAALLARERTKVDTPAMELNPAALDASLVVQRQFRCKGCGNHCMLTMNRFPTGDKFFSGNRCDFAMKSRGGARKEEGTFLAWKEKRLFGGVPLDHDHAPRGVIGIPRVLNMYEHYPYWLALFSALGFSVVLSRASDRGMVGKGQDTIPSQSLCFPAKLAHGHVADLAGQGITNIWLPCVPREGVPFGEAQGRFACPVVGGYPEALRLNMRAAFPQMRLLTPFVDLQAPSSVVRAIMEAFPAIPKREVERAVKVAKKALADYRADLHAHGEAYWRDNLAHGRPVVLLAGHPYHLDPLVNHGIPSLIESMGAAVVTEDAVSHLAPTARDLDVVNQWTFHSRLYRAAELVLATPGAELVQLVSFGCGIDAITSEQIKRLLEPAGKLYTLLKIDEGDTLGAARIRLKSLLAAMADRVNAAHTQPIHWVTKPAVAKPKPEKDSELRERVLFAPQMAPLHFPLVTRVLQSLGWQVRLLPEVTPADIELGLKHVNNDACYPAIVVIGQLLAALQREPNLDHQKTAVLLAQTCGPCRATNYPSLMRWALEETGMKDIPIVSISGNSFAGVERLGLGLKGLHRLMLAVIYGDMLQRLWLHARAFALHPEAVEALRVKWTQRGGEAAASGDTGRLQSDLVEMAADFKNLPSMTGTKPKVGIVGEILLTYHPQANLEIVDSILKAGAEPFLPDFASFFLYCMYDAIFQAKNFAGSKWEAAGSWLALQHFEGLRAIMNRALQLSGLEGAKKLSEQLDLVKGVVSAGQEAGEGWLLTADMLDYLERGIDNIVCLQPFGCLPNHVTGRGVMRWLRETYAKANVCAIDYEAGTSKANVANRLMLFLNQARAAFAEPQAPTAPAANEARDMKRAGMPAGAC